MKKYILIISILTLTACSNHKNDLANVDSGGEKYAVNHNAKAEAVKNNDEERLACKRAQKSKSPIQVKECTRVAQIEAEQDRSKETLTDRKLSETRSIVQKRER